MFDGLYEELRMGRLKKTLNIKQFSNIHMLFPNRDAINGWVYIENLDIYRHYVNGTIHCDFGPAQVSHRGFVFVFNSSEVPLSVFMNVYNKKLLASIDEL